MNGTNACLMLIVTAALSLVSKSGCISAKYFWGKGFDYSTLIFFLSEKSCYCVTGEIQFLIMIKIFKGFPILHVLYKSNCDLIDKVA